LADVPFPYAVAGAQADAKIPAGAVVYDEAATQAAIAKFQEERAHHASTINILANALYRVFSKPTNDDGTRGRLREACIEYLSLGGAYAAGPVGLLAGLSPKPEVLVTHFFLVAGYAMRRALVPFPTPTKLRQSYDLLRIACTIILPLLQAEKVTPLSSWPALTLLNGLFAWKSVDPSTL
jgi:squalene monooxygenase